MSEWDELARSIHESDERGANPLMEAVARMNWTHENPARLFNRHDGLCHQLETYIAKHQGVLDDAHFDAGDKPMRRARDFHPQALESIALMLSAAVSSEKRKAQKNGFPFVSSEFERSWAFALLAYCTAHKQPAPPHLMNAIFHIMGCQSLKAAPGFAQQIGLVGADIDKREQCAEAARLDGVARAEGRKLSENGLAKSVGVGRRTIGRWRERDDYKRTVEIVCEEHLESVAIHKEIFGE